MKSACIIIFFSLLCIGIGIAFACPLLNWALISPKTYTAAVIAFFCLHIINLIIKKILKRVKRNKETKKLLSSTLIALAMICANADSPRYPEIKELVSRNFLYAQYEEEVQMARKALKAGKAPYINFYTYTAVKGDTIFTLSARCAVTQETLATINGIENSSAVLEGKKLILPTVPGLYIPLQPSTQIEFLIAKGNSVKILSESYPEYEINGKKYYFLMNERFSPEERAFFLDSGMGLPLERYILTSSFGMRKSPISGKWKFHKGIDMAAPTGTPVMACKGGTVQYVGRNDYVYGNYIIIKHDGDITSKYAHLSDIKVSAGQAVSKGTVIGKVGTTGLATGPHLHFEIQLKGEAENPQKYLNK
ncbi:MAG: M23 family metallopeptidase [Treponema sp.]|nr:M23 family metallopeptidase [Treponema sp.]